MKESGGGGGGGGGHLNTSVIHMHDQRLSKHTLIEICLLRKNTIYKNFALFLRPILPLKQDFLGTHFVEHKKFEKCPQ